MKILTVVIDGITYRFTDIIQVDDHFLGHQILDDNTIGKMEHKITEKDYEKGAVTEVDAEILH